MARFSALTESQTAKIAADAETRADGGHEIFIVTLVPLQIAAWGDIVETIEGIVWELEHFTLAKEGHAVAVFRRSKGL